MKLVDVGVWLAAVWGRHAHHPVAAGWFGKETDDIVFCRVTQMGLLRLLSSPAIMGDDAIDRSQAWRAFDQLWADERVLWADEPAGLDAVWRAISARDDKRKLATDRGIHRAPSLRSGCFSEPRVIVCTGETPVRTKSKRC